MKRIISGSVLFSIFLFSFTFTACLDDDSDDPSIYADAYIFAERSDSASIINDDSSSNVSYSLILNAYCFNYTIDSATAIGGSTLLNYTLNGNGGYFSYYDGPYDNPNDITGSYNFNLSYLSGISPTSTKNTVNFNVLDPTKIISCIGDKKTPSINLKWNYFPGAEVLIIRLKDPEGNTLFTYNDYYYSENGYNEYIISNETGTWEEGASLYSGVSYTVEILGIIMESETSSYIQAEALTSAAVVWEE